MHPFLHNILLALFPPYLHSPPSTNSFPRTLSNMLAFVTDIFSRGFRNPRKTKPAPLNQEPGNGNNGSGGSGGGSGSNFGSPSAGLIPGSPSAQRITQKPLFLCKPFVTSQLVKGSFSTIVVLPRYVDQGEWLALNRAFAQLP